MTGERDTGLDFGEEMRIEAIERQIEIDDNWELIFGHIAEYSSNLNVSSRSVTFEGVAENIGKGDFYIKVRVLSEKTKYEPRVVAASLYHSPRGEKDQGTFLQVGSAQADWALGSVYLDRPSPQPVALNSNPVMDNFDLVTDVHRIIDEKLDIFQSPNYTEGQTDLMQ